MSSSGTCGQRPLQQIDVDVERRMPSGTQHLVHRKRQRQFSSEEPRAGRDLAEEEFFLMRASLHLGMRDGGLPQPDPADHVVSEQIEVIRGIRAAFAGI